MQRLRVGLGGLGAILLLVTLASTMTQQARQADDNTVVAEGRADKPVGPANDPLVDMGVVPQLPGEQVEVIVPDLPAEQMVTPEDIETPARSGSGAGR